MRTAVFTKTRVRPNTIQQRSAWYLNSAVNPFGMMTGGISPQALPTQPWRLLGTEIFWSWCRSGPCPPALIESRLVSHCLGDIQTSALSRGKMVTVIERRKHTLGSLLTEKWGNMVGKPLKENPSGTARFTLVWKSSLPKLVPTTLSVSYAHNAGVKI